MAYFVIKSLGVFGDIYALIDKSARKYKCIFMFLESNQSNILMPGIVVFNNLVTQYLSFETVVVLHLTFTYHHYKYSIASDVFGNATQCILNVTVDL